VDIYTPFAQVIKHLGLPEYDEIFRKYYEMRKLLNQEMHIGIIPWFYTELLQEFNTLCLHQKLSMIIEWQHITWEQIFENAHDKYKAIMHFMTPYHGNNVDNIILKPAIYVFEDLRVVFDTELQKDAVLAVQIRKYNMSKNGSKKAKGEI